MKKTLLLLVLIFTFAYAAADPKLALIKNDEWKGPCRKEKGPSFASLQSSYSFQKGNLIWWVKSFADNACKKIIEANKSIMKCEFSERDQFAKCNETALEGSRNGIAWESKPMLDYAGHPNKIEMKVKLSQIKLGQVKITTVGESEDPSSEILAK
jgi:hypothetical protein